MKVINLNLIFILIVDVNGSAGPIDKCTGLKPPETQPERALTLLIKNNSKCNLTLVDAIPFNGYWNKHGIPPKAIVTNTCVTMTIQTRSGGAEGWVIYRCNEDMSVFYSHFHNTATGSSFCKVRALAYLIHRDMITVDGRHCAFKVVIDEKKKEVAYDCDDQTYHCRCPMPAEFFYLDNHYANDYNETFIYFIASTYKIV